MEHLIANTGIQFVNTHATFNVTEPLRLRSGRVLRYSFVETEDPFDSTIHFDLLFNRQDENCWVPVGQMRRDGLVSKLPNGLEEVDDTGVPKMAEGLSAALIESYPDDDDGIISINTLESFRVPDPRNPYERVPAIDLIEGRWLPMPMYEVDSVGLTTGQPMAWCRVRLSRQEDPEGEAIPVGQRRYKLTWAFDTHTAEDALSVNFPYFYDDTIRSKTFELCDRPDALFAFLSIEEGQDHFSRYVASLLGITPEKLKHHRYKFIAWYIYFINYLRVAGAAPKVTLYNPADGDIDVDLSLDIGNSRTCGVLTENGDFTKTVMLELRDLGDPSIVYNGPIDMRLVFRKADFGSDLLMPAPEEAFEWKSIVRIGEEARRLIYHSVEDPGIAERANNYSSPKRYLWDNRPSTPRWEFLVTDTDSFSVSQNRNIFLENFTELFDESGSFREDGDTLSVFDFDPERGVDDCHYSRSSLMTMVMVELLQHAVAQINSPEFRAKHGDIDCRRRLRRVIITCPTAMPRAEQIKLRQSMVDACKVLRKCNPTVGEISVIPSPESLRITDDYDMSGRRMWSFDEATACQLVYLYAELAERYCGETARFFNTKGHVRNDLLAEGYDKPSLTVGSIDIGAGTTDIMICSYKREGDRDSFIRPVPHFYDSYYIAGDDILRNIVQRVIIEGPDRGLPDMGSIHSALLARLEAMTDDELRNHPACHARFTDVYRNTVDDIIGSHSPERRAERIRYFASILTRDFFGHDSAMMSFKDRQARIDFNTQISVPMAREFMNLLRLQRPSRVYDFEHFFPTVKPSEHLLRHFREHFGFGFEELSWRFDPESISAIVRSTMEPLIKQLSVLLYAYQCDILVLAGRPTSIDAIPELLLKHFPMSPDRIIRLTDYRPGGWYPFADGQGYFYDQKSVVAVGAMIGYLASTTGFNGLRIDFSEMIRRMKSTSNFIGLFDSSTEQVKESILTPHRSSATVTVSVFPAFLGCKQFDSPLYQARPLYGIYSDSSKPLRITLARTYQDDREVVTVDEVTDVEGNPMPKSTVEVSGRSIVADGCHWLDKGEFVLRL